MSAFTRYARLAAAASLAGLAGCGSTSAGSPGVAHSPAPATAAPSTSSPAPSVQPGGPAQACSQAGTYLTAVRTGEHSGYDQVVFQFSGMLPGYTIQRVQAVYSDPKGTPVPLAGQSYLRVVFHGTSAACPQPPHQTYIGPSVLTPYYPQLLTVTAAGDFEGVLSFGVGLAAQGGYHAVTLTNPGRLVIDVSHVALGTFPGIWDITSWPQYWAVQYSWLNGHQPWLPSPPLVVQVWAGGIGSGSVVRQVSANTFEITKPDGTTYTVTGLRPVSVPGPWVITKIT
jgi:hypothetical protein